LASIVHRILQIQVLSLFLSDSSPIQRRRRKLRRVWRSMRSRPPHRRQQKSTARRSPTSAKKLGFSRWQRRNPASLTDSAMAASEAALTADGRSRPRRPPPLMTANTSVSARSTSGSHFAGLHAGRLAKSTCTNGLTPLRARLDRWQVGRVCADDLDSDGLTHQLHDVCV
jgi:hypothetical protein